MRVALLYAIALVAASPAYSAAEDESAVRHHDAAASDTAHRLLVQRRTVSARQDGSDIALQLLKETGVTLRHTRGATGEVEVFDADAATSAKDIQRTLRKLQARPDVKFAVVDQRRQAHAVPSDALYSTQWYLQDVQPSAIAANTAWDVSTGGTGTVVAVLDTGVRFDHPDLQRAAQAGKLLPGYDFVSGEGAGSFLIANDGDGWDDDPSDPGDWVDSTDKQQTIFSNCKIANSSWHGTRVAGMIGAASNNGIGVSGVSWGAYILPVRVLGKCGGYDRDILPAMRWAAGLHVSGVPDNPYPAKILNLSFGSADPCNAAYISVLQELTALGVTVFVSAGNEGGPVDAPANCPLAIAVAGLRHIGTKVGYSSLGPEIVLAAPAGNCFNLSGPCLFSLHTTYDIGTTVPAGSDYTNQINTNLGTSFSAPLVAGVAALMHAVNDKLTATQLRARLVQSARAFPVSSDVSVPACHVPVAADDLQVFECNCTNVTCGAGMLHAQGAIVAAQRPIVSVSVPAIFAAASSLVLDASASSAACNRTIVSYQWSVVGVTGTSSPVLSPSDQPTLQISSPTTGTYTLRLTITDNQGASDSGDVVINSTTSSNATESLAPGSACPAALSIAQQPQIVTPTAAASSGGGGGYLDWQWLALLLTFGIARAVWRRPSHRMRNQHVAFVCRAKRIAITRV